MSTLLETTKKILSDKLAEDIVTINMQKVNPFTDYFVICSARNIRHIDSLAKDLSKGLQEKGFPIRTQEGQEGSQWILIDAYDVVIHIFTQDARQQYRLELLWADQPTETEDN